jgi:hypothetical protein
MPKQFPVPGRLGVSDIAITALIVETPIGLLYIIARNLFPQRRMPGESRASAKVKPERPKRKPPAVAQSLQQLPELAKPKRRRTARASNAQFQIAVRTLGRLVDPKEFADIVVKQSSTAVVRLKDVGRIELAAVD